MAPLWVLVIAHWMCCSITHEIMTYRRFSRDWLIDRSPSWYTYFVCLHLCTQIIHLLSYSFFTHPYCLHMVFLITRLTDSNPNTFVSALCLPVFQSKPSAIMPKTKIASVIPFVTLVLLKLWSHIMVRLVKQFLFVRFSNIFIILVFDFQKSIIVSAVCNIHL